MPFASQAAPEISCSGAIESTNTDTTMATLLAGGTVTVNGIDITVTANNRADSFTADGWLPDGVHLNRDFDTTTSSITYNFSEPISRFETTFGAQQDQERITFSHAASYITNEMNSTYNLASSIMSQATLINGGMELRSNLTDQNPGTSSESFGSNSVVTWDFPIPTQTLTITNTGSGQGGPVTITSGTVATTNYNGTIIGGAFKITTCPAAVDTDYSDAPADGSTAPDGSSTTAYGTAGHIIVSGLQLGPAIDAETGSIASADAGGDGADDDGVSGFPPLTVGATSYILSAANIRATGTGTLHAWIDFDKDGVFSASEHASVAVNAGVLSGGGLSWSGVPAGAAGATFARLRLTSDVLTDDTGTPQDERATGLASNGEVEDYALTLTVLSYPADANVDTCPLAVGATFTPSEQIIWNHEANGSPPDKYTVKLPLGADIASAPPITAGSGIDYLIQVTSARILGADQTGRVAAYEQGDYAQYAFTTSASVTPGRTWKQLRYGVINTVNTVNQFPYKISVLVSTDPDFATASLLVDGHTVTLPATYLQTKVPFIRPIFLKPSTTYYMRVIYHDSTAPSGELHWDDVALGFVNCRDQSDAPTASTGYGAPTHVIPENHTLQLGTAIDGDGSTSLAGTNADGDDASGLDDEDGVSLNGFALDNALLNEGPQTLTVETVSSGYLNAWIDFNRDGDFADAGEQIATDISSSGGPLTLDFTPPAGMQNGDSYARFRYSSATGLGPDDSTPAPDGEVEDYKVRLFAGSPYACDPGLYQSSVNSYRKLNPATATYDIIGDLGSETSIGYNVLDNIIYGVRKNDANVGEIIAIASDGSYASLGFATRIDTGAPLVLSAAQLAIDGENNIWMGNWMINLNTMIAIPVVFSGDATKAWDWAYLPGAGGSKGKLYGVHNNDLYITDMDSAITTGTGTSTQVQVTTTVTTVAGLGSSSGGYGAAWTDLNQDLYVYHNSNGKVYQILNQDSAAPSAVLVANTSPLGNNDGASCPLAPAPFYDYGNAPAPYATLISANGPAHAYLSGLRLGASLTRELNGYDNDPSDGVTLYGASLQGQTLTGGQTVTLKVATTGAATLYGFIDWNGDGDFGDAGEALPPLSSSGGVENLSITPPVDIITGMSYARFRYSTDPAAAAPVGLALNGEVEDYQINLLTGGVSVSGRVYLDRNVDGVNAATEAGIADVTVVLYDTINAVCISTRTGADGAYSFSAVSAGIYQLYEAARETVPVPQTCDPAAAADPGGYFSSTANAPAAFSVGTVPVNDRDFGDVRAPQFNLDNEKTTTPDQVVVYPHTFSSPTDGSVTFNVIARYPDPASLSWNVRVYIDSNCDAILGEGDVLHTAAVPLTAGEQVCLLVRVQTPGATTSGALLTSVIESAFVYGDGSLGLPADLQQHTDITRIIAGSGMGGTPATGTGVLDLRKAVWNVTRDINGDVVLPGETLRYTITYANVGDGHVNELVIHDSLPEFTRLISGSMDCSDHPPELPLCSESASADGSLEWRWAGTDHLAPGSSGTVSYEVEVE